MTRKDYVLLAAALLSVQPPKKDDGNFLRVAEGRRMWRACVDAVADALSTENPRFDRERFVKACEADR